MRDDQVLVDAGVEHAKVVIVATNDDMANLEVALDSRRMNPSIRCWSASTSRRSPSKIQGAFGVDLAFSSAALAAPVIVDARARAVATASLPQTTRSGCRRRRARERKRAWMPSIAFTW